MAERIDELQLLIGSDASKAIEQLGSLAKALDTAASSASRMAGATKTISSFSVGLSRIANTNLDKAISNLERLSKLDLSNLKDKKVNIDISISGADRMDRIRFASAKAEKDISKNLSSMAGEIGKQFNMSAEGVSNLKTVLSEIAHEAAGNHDLSAGIDKFKDAIHSDAKIAAADLLGLRNHYIQFIKDVYNSDIDPSEMSADEMKEWSRVGLEKALKKNGSTKISDFFDWSIDGGSFANIYSDIIDSFNAPDNPQDQFELLRLKVVEVAQALKTLGDSDVVNEKIGGVAENATAKIQELLEVATSKHMTETADKIPLDLNIDQTRFEIQIQKAIDRATGKTYASQPIKLRLDNQQLKENVEAAFSLIDLPKLPQFAEGFASISASISTLNQTNMKDTGLNQFTNSIRRLVSTDTSKFDIKTFEGIAASIKDIAGIGDVGKGLNGFVSSIARLANAGEKTSQTAEGMKRLTPEIKTAVKTFIELGTIDTALTSFIASLSRLATAGKKTDETASGLSNLSQAVMEFINALSGAPEINENIANTIQGLGNLAAAGASAGKAMNSVMNGGSSGGNGFAKTAVDTFIRSYINGLKGLLNIALKLGGQGAAALGNFLGRLNLIPTSANSIDRTALSFSNLLRAVLPFYGLRGMFEWGKEALNAGSSIVELENVIDTSFGNLKKGYEDISGYIYKWAETTIDAFGVSQIAAERYAGRLMAMFNSSGFDITEGMRDSAAKMTTDLIERAGDIASFYDISVDEAMTKMQAGLAGMTRPLRSLGINMSVANMQAFALSRGITTAWKEMDQATQMALRYEYMLHATQYVQGDFARTSGRVIAPCYREVA